MNRIRILLVDDHGVLRAGLQMMIDAQPDMQVIGQAADGDEAVLRVREACPDVIVLDVVMPRTSGMTLVGTLRELCPTARILMLTMHDEPAVVRAALDAGATGFVAKEALGDDLLAAIRAVHNGRAYINAMPSHPAVGPSATARTVEALSQRELQVLDMLAQGYTNQEIGQKLHLSPRTIGTYRYRINDKLGLRTRADIVKYAREAGLLSR